MESCRIGLLLGTPRNHPAPNLYLVAMAVNMGNKYLKKPKFCQIFKTKTFNYKLRTQTIYLESCSVRLLLGTPRICKIPG